MPSFAEHAELIRKHLPILECPTIELFNMAYEATPVKVESLITKAADEIRRFIDLREMVPGATLPPETQLATMLGISRNSLREALRILDSLGFIEKRAGKQAVVRSRLGLVRRVADPANVLEGLPVAYEARMVIEQRCAELAAGRAEDQELANLASLLDAFESELDLQHYEAASHIHRQFHDSLVLIARNPLLSEIYAGISSAITHQTDVLPESLKDRSLRTVHRAIYEALTDRSASKAGQAVRRHFRANRPRVEFRVHAQEQKAAPLASAMPKIKSAGRAEAVSGGRARGERRR